MTRDPRGGSGTRALIFMSLAHFTNDGTVFLVPVVVDLLAVTHHISATLIAASLTLFYVSMAVSAIALGPVIDRKHLRVEGIFFGIFALSLGLLLFSLALDDVLLPLFLPMSSIVTGFGASFYHPIGASILQSSYRGSGKLGRYLGINGAAGGLGRAVYPSLLLLVALAFGSKVSSVRFFGSLGVALSLLVFVGLRGHDRGRGSSHGRVEPAEPEAPGAGGQAAGRIALLTVIALIRSFAFFGILAWIPEYISFDRGVGAGISLGTVLTLMYSGAIVGQPIWGRLVEDHDRRTMLAVSTALSALLMFLYIRTSGSVSLVALALFGFVNFSTFPIFMSMISDYVPRGAMTTNNALVWNLGSAGGQAVGPLVVGLMIGGNYASLSPAFDFLLAIAIAPALMALKLPKPASGPERPALQVEEITV